MRERLKIARKEMIFKAKWFYYTQLDKNTARIARLGYFIANWANRRRKRALLSQIEPKSARIFEDRYERPLDSR